MMRTSLRVEALTAIFVFGLFLLASATTVHAGDWYVGADNTNRIIYTDGNYNTAHLRLRGGYKLSRRVAIEIQAMDGGKDTDLGYEGFREWSAGPSYGIFIRPFHAIHHDRVEVYGLIGTTRMETTYHFMSTGIEDKDRIWSGAVGVGMQYNHASGFGASIDVLWTFGRAKYPHLYNPTNSSSEDVATATLGAGLNYRF